MRPRAAAHARSRSANANREQVIRDALKSEPSSVSPSIPPTMIPVGDSRAPFPTPELACNCNHPWTIRTNRRYDEWWYEAAHGSGLSRAAACSARPVAVVEMDGRPAGRPRRPATASAINVHMPCLTPPSLRTLPLPLSHCGRCECPNLPDRLSHARR